MKLINKMINEKNIFIEKSNLSILYIQNNVENHIFEKNKDCYKPSFYNSIICDNYTTIEEDFDDFVILEETEKGFKTLDGIFIAFDYGNLLDFNLIHLLKDKGYNINEKSCCWIEKLKVNLDPYLKSRFSDEVSFKLMFNSSNVKGLMPSRRLNLSKQALEDFENYNIISKDDLINAEQNIRNFMIKSYNINRVLETRISR